MFQNRLQINRVFLLALIGLLSVCGIATADL